MFEIKKNKIILTRGDTAIIECKANDKFIDGEAVLTVKKHIQDSEAILSVQAVDSVFYIYPEDTIGIAAGSYVYDIEIRKDGMVNSSPIGTFEILRGVTE